MAGALDESVYRDLLAGAGFTGIEFQETRRYQPRELCERFVMGGSCCRPSFGGTRAWDVAAFDRFEESGGAIFSAFARAAKRSE